MANIRRLGAGLLVSLLFVVIAIGLPLLALASVATDRQAIIEVASSPSAYQLIKSGALSLPLGEAGVEQETAAEAEAINPQSIKPIIDRYFSPDFHQRLVAGVVNGLYDWLEGKTDHPQFAVKISDNPAEFKQLAVEGFVSRYQALPECTPGTVFATEYNALEADCRVSSISAEQLKTAIEQQLDKAGLDRLFASATISSDEFLQDTSQADLKRLKTVHDTLQISKLLIAVAIIMLSGLIFWAVPGTAKGLKTLGKALLVPSSLVLIVGGLVRFLQPAIVANLAPTGDSAALSQLAHELATGFLAQVNNRWLLYSLILIAISAGLLFTQRLFKHPTANSNSLTPNPKQAG